MMNVSDWRDGRPGNVTANGFMTAGTLPAGGGVPAFSAAPSWTSPPDAPLVNAAPVLHPTDGYAYIFATGLYRASPVYLARVTADAAALSNASSYEWWLGGGGGCGGGGQWGPSSAAAVPLLPDFAGVGELSARWDDVASTFVLCFFNYANETATPVYVSQAAATPTGAVVSSFHSDSGSTAVVSAWQLLPIWWLPASTGC